MDWLQIISIVSLVLAGICALWIALDIFAAGHRQKIWIMNGVWPITALYAGPLALLAYYRVGRLSTKEAVRAAKARDEKPPGKKKPFWQMVALGASHCGSGCTLADIVGEWALFFFPLTLFGMKIFGPQLSSSSVIAGENRTGLLVYDAARDAGRIPDQLPGELLAAAGGDKGED